MNSAISTLSAQVKVHPVRQANQLKNQKTSLSSISYEKPATSLSSNHFLSTALPHLKRQTTETCNRLTIRVLFNSIFKKQSVLVQIWPIHAKQTKLLAVFHFLD